MARTIPPAITTSLKTTETARYLDITVDMLRDWERNGLITVPRDPQTGQTGMSALPAVSA